MARENVLEWLSGQDTITVSVTQIKQINRIYKLKEKYPDEVEIIRKPEENNGLLYAHIPLRALHLYIQSATTNGNPFFKRTTDVENEDFSEEDGVLESTEDSEEDTSEGED